MIEQSFEFKTKKMKLILDANNLAADQKSQINEKFLSIEVPNRFYQLKLFLDKEVLQFSINLEKSLSRNSFSLEAICLEHLDKNFNT